MCNAIRKHNKSARARSRWHKSELSDQLLATLDLALAANTIKIGSANLTLPLFVNWPDIFDCQSRASDASEKPIAGGGHKKGEVIARNLHTLTNTLPKEEYE